MGTVKHDQRLPLHHFQERAGQFTSRKPVATAASGKCQPVRVTLRCRRRRRRRWRPDARRADSVQRRPAPPRLSREQRRLGHLRGNFSRLVMEMKIDAHCGTALAAADCSITGRASDDAPLSTGRPGLTMPAFSIAMLATRGRAAGVVEADARDERHERRADVRRIEAAAETDFDHGDIARRRRKCRKPTAVPTSKNVGGSALAWAADAGAGRRRGSHRAARSIRRR